MSNYFISSTQHAARNKQKHRCEQGSLLNAYRLILTAATKGSV